MSKLKQLREARGLRKEHLAIAAGCSAVYIERLESGRQSNPTIKIAQRIAAALGAEINDLWPMGDNAVSA